MILAWPLAAATCIGGRCSEPTIVGPRMDASAPIFINEAAARSLSASAACKRGV